MKSRIPFSHVEGSCRSYIEIGLSDTGLTRPSYLFHLAEHAAKMRSLLNSIVDGDVCGGSRFKPLLRYFPLTVLRYSLSKIYIARFFISNDDSTEK